MVMKGETIKTGASAVCDCGVKLKLEVLHSGAGYYIGTACNYCGPWSRESGYYPNAESAQRDLSFVDADTWGR